MSMKENLDKKKIIFCGGHHTSSLPLIDSLLDEGNFELVFIGRKKPLRMIKMIPWSF